MTAKRRQASLVQAKPSELGSALRQAPWPALRPASWAGRRAWRPEPPRERRSAAVLALPVRRMTRTSHPLTMTARQAPAFGRCSASAGPCPLRVRGRSHCHSLCAVWLRQATLASRRPTLSPIFSEQGPASHVPPSPYAHFRAIVSVQGVTTAMEAPPDSVLRWNLSSPKRLCSTLLTFLTVSARWLAGRSKHGSGLAPAARSKPLANNP